MNPKFILIIPLEFHHYIPNKFEYLISFLKIIVQIFN